MAKTNKVMIQVCLCGAGTKKDQAPTVPYTAEELADQIVECAKAGASIAHIHVREDKMVDGVMQIGYKSMSLQKFTEAVEVTREKCKEAGVDIVINLTTSGGEYEDYKRLQHLGVLRPEMCSFDPNTINWANSYIFENSPRFLNLLSQEVVKYDVKPEFEVFDTGKVTQRNRYRFRLWSWGRCWFLAASCTWMRRSACWSGRQCHVWQESGRQQRYRYQPSSCTACG